MIARWMLAAILFTLLTGVAALAAERALRALRLQQRAPWCAALVISLLWPALAPGVASMAPAPPTAVAPLALFAGEPMLVAASAAAGWIERFDSILVALWIALSLTLLVGVVRALRALQQARRLAQPMHIDGEPVLVTKSLGPAVVGVLSPSIVVPSWLLELDGPLRSLVIRHEREHREAGDTRLVWLGVVATVLMPWNPALWWIARRLRLAMEIDCDARTLRGEPAHAGYAKLLLLIAHRQSTVRFVPMLADPSSHLGRRISAMRSAPVSHPVLRAVGLCAIASLAIIAACSPRIAGNLTGPAPATAPTPAPTASATTGSAPTSNAPGSEVAPPGTSGRPYFRFQVSTPATMKPGTAGPAYPPELRVASVEGAVLAQFVVNSDGSIDTGTFKVLKSDHPLLTEAVRAHLSAMPFLPAEMNGAKVRQLVQLPFEFSLKDGSALLPVQRPELTSAAPQGTVGAPAISGSLTAKQLERVNAETAESARRDAAAPYFDFQTTRPARMVAGSTGPAYPPQLRTAGIEGRVLAQFVVDESGRVDLNTFKVLKSDHVDFTESVKLALRDMRFVPADVKGNPVKQLLEQPFQFSVSR